MKPYEIRRKLRQARIDIATAVEDYIEGARNAPDTALKIALLEARGCTELLREPDSEHGLKLLADAARRRA